MHMQLSFGSMGEGERKRSWAGSTEAARQGSKLLGRKAGGDAHRSRAPLQCAKERKMLLGKAGLQNWVLAEWRGESRATALGILILILIPFLHCHILTLPTDPPASVCTMSRADAAAAAFLHYLLLCSGRDLCFPWGRILTGFDFKEQIPPHPSGSALVLGPDDFQAAFQQEGLEATRQLLRRWGWSCQQFSAMTKMIFNKCIGDFSGFSFPPFPPCPWSLSKP